MAYYAVEPWGQVQEDARAGMLASLAFNANRGKGSKALKPEDFFPSLRVEEDKANTVEEMRLAARAWCALVGGKILEKGP